MHSFTEENYLKIIYLLSERSGGEEISTNSLAEHTKTKAASVTDMLRKLAEKELIHYKKYQGVRLTKSGELLALQVIRKHRLWELFLVEKLGFRWDEVHQLAEDLEHIQSEELTNRLDDFLDNPTFDPHGDPIPDATGKMPQSNYQRLVDVPADMDCVMMGVSVHSTDFLQHLDKLKLTLGCKVKIVELSAFDRSLQIELNGEQRIFISHEVARNVLVRQ